MLTEPTTAPADQTAHHPDEALEQPATALTHPVEAAAEPVAAPAEVELSHSPVQTPDPQVELAEPAPIEAAGGGDENDASDAPEPVPARAVFADLGLSAPLLQAIAEMGYLHPTPIQEQAIPVVLMGRDVLGVAQTGTGKTASFTLPLMDILAGSRARARMPRSLILEPTRELALQVAENFVQYGKHLKLTHALLIGGESMNDQKDALMRGVDVLIATPGRLIDLFERGGLLMTDARILVIDEADRMLDMGFIPDVERIVGWLPRTRQTLFFSATMAPEIKRLSDAFLTNPKVITVSRPASVATTIVAGMALIDDVDKREALRRLIKSEDVQSALIFCNRKTEVDILYKSLKKHDFSVAALHGDLSQTERTATMARFKAGEVRLVVCSDVAARGIDIGGLSHVFNFDVPHHAEDYVHRIGRTGRAGLTGHAFTLATPEDRLAVEAIEALIGMPIPRMDVAGLDTAEWAEGDGKKRRGRGRAPAKPAARDRERATPDTDKPAREVRAPRAPKPIAAPVDDQGPQPEIAQQPRPEPRAPRRAATAPRSSEARAPEARAPEARAPEAREPEARAPEPRQQEPRQQEQRRARTSAPQPAPAEEQASAAPLASRERSGGPRREGRDGRYRDEDLGPRVKGFGDDVPAFMMIKVRTRGTEVQQPEDVTV